MATARSSPRTVPEPPAPPRRLSREVRRTQLVEAAVAVLARQGLADFSLDDVAARAGVTRNLLYHYFERGRSDIAVAVVTLAERQLTAEWAFDEDVPLADRVKANLERIADHALRPTHAWRIHRQSRASLDPDVRAVVGRFDERAVSGIAHNQLGTAQPPPLARVVLRGYLAFAETVLDEGRATGAPRATLMRVLTDTLAMNVAAAASG